MPREAPTFNTLIDHQEEAEAYARTGLAVVPLLPGEKRAAIPWKAYQTVAPTPNEVNGWWRERPDAGMAAVLGPVSDVLAIDVDGPDAHAELVRRLGAEPVAPKVLTGSRKPYRYQLLFRHPEGVATRSKITPCHPQLEFRGRGGLSVLPPSVHPSGRRYRWGFRRSLEEMDRPELSPLILDALRADAEGRGNGNEVIRGAVTVGWIG
ncbi:MAG TPA: bifunctional DNA primase/polymerase [Gemmata sp.]